MPASGPVFRIWRPGVNRGGDHVGCYPDDGQLIHPWNVSQMVNRYLHSIGIAKTAHCLRHSFATNIYRTTRDLRLTQELMGHASPATTAIYAACDMEKAAPAVAALSIEGLATPPAHETPARERIADTDLSSPPGTLDVAAVLDELKVPLDASGKAAARILRDAGRGRGSAAVGAAVKFRRARAGIALPSAAADVDVDPSPATLAVAALLDELEVPLDSTYTAGLRILREAGRGRRKDVVSSALKLRRARARARRVDRELVVRASTTPPPAALEELPRRVPT